MIGVINFLLNTLNSLWFALISDPIKSITAFAAIGGLIIGWKNLRKDSIRVSVVVERAQNGPLILQNPQEEYLLFKVYNQGISPIVVNEVGIKIPRKTLKKTKFINLVDLAYSSLQMRGCENAIGSIECVGLPGEIPAKSTGIFLLKYTSMREGSINYQRQNIPPSNQNFVGSQRLIRTFQEFHNLEQDQGQYLKIIPYAVTGCAKRFVGKKAIIKLGHLGDAAIW